MDHPHSSSGDDSRAIEASIEELAAGDQAARDQLMALACDRMRSIAHRMLRRFPNVRRWEETDDVLQNAALRLYRALGQIVPNDARGFLGLAALQIRRELLDLARKHAADGAYAANHETNYYRHGNDLDAKIDGAADPKHEPDRIARWTRLHEAAAALPDEEREVFHLVWYLGLTQAAAAKALGCSTRTIKRRWEAVKTLMAKALHDCPLD